jgi:hypothetical protein
MTEEIFGLLPSNLRDELLSSFKEITTNFKENRWEPSELNGGKLCEIVFSILDGYTKNLFPERSSKPSNMVDACLSLSEAPTTFPRSVKIQIPRIIMALYEVRNNRGVGHVGGDVNPNQMDATVVFYISKWLMAEMVRIFHDVDTETATSMVELLMEREIPTIWCVGGKKRVLDTKLNMKEKTLLILYSENCPVDEEDLVSWTEHTNKAVFRRDILVKGHKAKLWEYDKQSGIVTLSPTGIVYVEQKLYRNL